MADLLDNLTPAAKVTAVLSAAFALLSGVLMFFLSRSVLLALVYTVLTALVGVFWVYDVNCVSRGGCNVWGWFKTAMIAVMSVVSFLSTWQYIRLQRALLA